MPILSAWFKMSIGYRVHFFGFFTLSQEKIPGWVRGLPLGGRDIGGDAEGQAKWRVDDR
ncbi:hypothetical protein DESC_160035 [Desulfosarcina cetonica]|nr:hypothetical protein DESC_160035 [Desulfosarcina cetonica]